MPDLKDTLVTAEQKAEPWIKTHSHLVVGAVCFAAGFLVKWVL